MKQSTIDDAIRGIDLALAELHRSKPDLAVVLGLLSTAIGLLDPSYDPYSDPVLRPKVDHPNV